jgi:hypothetical protein
MTILQLNYPFPVYFIASACKPPQEFPQYYHRRDQTVVSEQHAALLKVFVSPFLAVDVGCIHLVQYTVTGFGLVIGFI